jgi:protein TonB
MLDQLVESKSNAQEDSRRGQFMAVTLVIAVVVVLGLWTKDLFAQNFGMNAGDLELSTLVAPPPPDDPPPPEEKQPEKKVLQQQDVDIRKELIQNILSSPVKPPDRIQVDPSLAKAMRMNTKTMQGSADANTGSDVGTRGGAVVSGSTQGVADPVKGLIDTGEPPPPAAVVPKPATPKPAPRTVSGGVLNGKATSLPTPAYPAIAKAAGAKGAVSVQVLIDESGKVVSASAVSGHPMLRAAAVGAAQRARFSPTLLSGQAVKVSGVITYNFQ